MLAVRRGGHHARDSPVEHARGSGLRAAKGRAHAHLAALGGAQAADGRGAGGVRSVKPGELVAQNIAALVQGTRGHQLAMYVVYENPLPMLADDPAAYRDGRADLKFLREVPTTWDETRALAGEVGEFIVIARRHGTSWYVGAMNAMKPRELELRLDFLGP